jgi:hypothetical protein
VLAKGISLILSLQINPISKVGWKKYNLANFCSNELLDFTIPQVFDEKWMNTCNLTILGKFILNTCCYSRFQMMNIETGITVYEKDCPRGTCNQSYG